MIGIILNGQPRDVTASSSLSDLLTTLDVVPNGIAVAINGHIVVASNHQTTTLAAGDKIEIIRAVGGG